MACPNCEEQNDDCGCGSQALTINQICNPVQCEVPQCAESFDANCSIYTGPDIVCDTIVIVTAGTSMAQAVANISAYFCSSILNIALTPGPTGAAGANGTNGTNGIDGIDGHLILRRTAPMVVSPVSLLPYSLDNLLLPNTNDGIKITLFVIVADTSAGGVSILKDGVPIYVVDLTKIGTFEVTLFLTRSGTNMVGYGMTNEIVSGIISGNWTPITVANWFATTPVSLTFSSDGNANVTFGELTIEQLKAI